MNNQDEQHPFKVFNNTQSVKVFDLESSAGNGGRARILALVPKNKELPLEDIPFAIAWCHPRDKKHWNRKLANKIAAGRLYKLVYSGKAPINADYCAGTISSIKEIPQAVIKQQVKNDVAPTWASRLIKG